MGGCSRRLRLHDLLGQGLTIMPLPSKNKDEKQSEFMSRCMSDDIMEKEYKDNKQRIAVCLTQYRTRKKSKGEASWDDVRKGDVLGLI